MTEGRSIKIIGGGQVVSHQSTAGPWPPLLAMRVISFALVFSSVLGLVAGAVPHRRSTDTCANINLDIQLLIVVVKFGACLCLGGVDNAVATNPTLQLPVLTLGAPAVKKMLIDAVSRLIIGV
ncbi:hypothetical protein FRC12_015400 [Ceratobasidium sp. 428]|nr:hypothetical protein FRC12_015400 [Ceratobasidium sp. 428]